MLRTIFVTGCAEFLAKISGGKPGDHFWAWIVLVSRHWNTQIPIVRPIWRSDVYGKSPQDRTILFTGRLVGEGVPRSKPTSGAINRPRHGCSARNIRPENRADRIASWCHRGTLTTGPATNP
jgi:hypothetical protein